MMGADWSWTFDEEVAGLMKARGTVACPTMGAGARVEYEGGINILEMQPNPGKITKKETIDNGRMLRAAGVKMVPATDVGVTLTDFGEEIFFELEIYAGIGIRERSARSGRRPGTPRATCRSTT